MKNTAQNRGITGEDINIESVWRTYKGEGTYISIIDGDLQFDHPDLIDNVSTQHSVDYHPHIIDSSSHGTRVAGVAAARNNNIGVRGVAPQANIYSLNILGNGDDDDSIVEEVDVANALTHLRTMTAISNNSWGYSVPFQPTGSRRVIWETAIETGISEGFYGRGTVYVWAAGNERCFRRYVITGPISGYYEIVCNADNSNYDGYANYHATIAACAVDNRGLHANYSEFGANLWVCAPSIDSAFQEGIVTTTVSSDYTDGFGGTSASAPMVSGVAALIRQANPSLSWRDVKLILANSARQNDSTHSSWMQGATKYGAFDDDANGQYHFSHQYGFGVVNASKAVELAENWIKLPPRQPNTWQQTGNVQVGNSTSTSSLFIQSDINFIEHLDIYIALEHAGFNDLSIELISPSGRISELAVPSDRVVTSSVRGTWRFGSSRHLGEDPTGMWKLVFEDTRSTTGTLIAWGMRVRGYQVKLDAVAAGALSEENIEDTPLILSLSGARWKQNLQASDFRLKNALSGLRINQVSRLSDTQVELSLASDEGFAADYHFQVEATTGTISNRAHSLASGDVWIVSNKPIVRKAVLAPDGAVGSNYRFTIDQDTFESIEELTYKIDGITAAGLTSRGLEISGVPTTTGIYHATVTAITLDGSSTATSFTLRVRPRGYPIVVNPMLNQVAYINQEFTFNLNHVFVDSDMDSTLRYSLLDSPNWLHYTTATAILSGIANRRVNDEQYQIMIIATDDNGKSTETVLNLRVAMRFYVRTKAFLEGALE